MIALYSVRSVREVITPYIPTRQREDGTWAERVDATYDHPHRDHALVVADFKAGRPTPGDEVTVQMLGVGTTVATRREYRSRGWDDGDHVTIATYLDEAGEWQSAEVYWSSYCGCDGNEVKVDATPDVVAKWVAHNDALEAARLAAEKDRDDHEAALRDAMFRRSVSRGRFVIVSGGRKVPVGTVGRVFYVVDGRIGVATSTRTEPAVSARGTAYDKATDVAWCGVTNLDVLLEQMPDGRAEVELLYRCAAAVDHHARTRVFEAQKAVREARQAEGRWVPPTPPPLCMVEAFTALWRWAVERPERLAVMVAYGPAELPRLDADTPRTLEEVCEAVETMPDVAAHLGRVAAEWPGLAATDEHRAAVRADIVGCLGVVWTPPAKKARKPRAPKAAATASAR